MMAMRTIYICILLILLLANLCFSSPSDVILLSQKDWKEKTGTGTWFVEHFAPWCPHCRRFAPTWEKLATDLKGYRKSHDFHIAKVDCTVDEALCDTHKIEGYPTLIIFHSGGVQGEEYDGDRTYDDVFQFALKMANKFHQMPSKPTSTSQPDSPAVPEKPKQNTNVEKDKNEPGADDGKHTPDGVWVPKSNAKDSEDKQKSKKLDKPKEEEKAPQPDQNEVARKLFTNLLDAEQGQKYNLKGEVVDLTFSNFDELTKDGPWLVEFYAPWCGHCKNLAPTYTKLGAELKDKVNVAKVNGDQNRGLMDKFGIRGFPTIKYIRGSQIIDYRGPRTLEGLSSFALQASSISITLVTKSDFERMKDQNDVSVMFLFNSKTATSDMRTFISTAKTSVHQIPFYASYDPSFESSISRPSVLVYRKGFPASHNPLKYSGDFVVSKILNFIDSNKHPLLPELDESNSRDFLEPNENESSNRITVIGVLNPVGSDKQRKVLKSVAESLVGRFDDGNTKVICTWLDGVKFAEYIDKVYKIKSTDLSRVIINVAKEEEYFDVDPSGKPIQFTENAILDALNDVVDQVRGLGGKYVGKSMRGTLMSYIKWGTKQFGGVTNVVSSNPFPAALFGLAFFGFSIAYCCGFIGGKQSGYEQVGGSKFD